ncbi:MAG TPA: hypothetical protein DEP01_04840 [Aminobacterium sp.]|nr:hypothetical protein [Aminobacterium sp.]
MQVDESKFQSKAAKSVRSRVTNIKPWLPISMTMEEFKLSVIEEMSKTQRIEKYELSDEDFKNIEDLATQKYSTWAWNWGKSPQFTEKKSHRFKAGKVEIYFNVKDGIIISCKIYGDFFGDENIGELEKKLENCQYEEASLKKRLAPIPLNKYFVAIPSEELLNLICAR